MSKGNPIVQCRIDAETMNLVLAQLQMTAEHANSRTVLDNEVSSFVRIAVREKLAKMERGRRYKKKARAGVSPARAGSEGVSNQCTQGDVPDQAKTPAVPGGGC